MVGAIADWFAVTALFKHPLGLPIPHTALVPEAQGRARARGSRSSSARTSCRRRSSATGWRPPTISLRLGRWLSDPHNARRVVDEVADVASIALAGSRTSTSSSWSRRCWCRGSGRSRSRRCSARSWSRWCATTCTTAWSTWPSRSCTAGWWRTPRPSPRCSPSGRRGGRRPAQRGGHRADAHRGGALARGHPRRPPPPRPRGAGLDAGAARPGPAVRPRDPGPRRGAQAAAARPPAVHHHRHLAVERAAPRAARRRCGTRRAGAGPAGARSWSRSPTG